MTKEDRYEMGASLLVLMGADDALPLSNKGEVVRTMQEYFKRHGYIQQLKEERSRWVPTEDYWWGHMWQVQMALYAKHLYFGCLRGPCLHVSWRFMTKQEAEANLADILAELKTREASYNAKAEGGNEKWPSLRAPIASIHLLTSNGG